MAQTAAWKEETGIQGNWVCPHTKLLGVGYFSVAPSNSVPLSLIPTPTSFLLSVLATVLLNEYPLTRWTWWKCLWSRQLKPDGVKGAGG